MKQSIYTQYGKWYFNHLFSAFLYISIDFRQTADEIFRFVLFPKFCTRYDIVLEKDVLTGKVRKGFDIRIGSQTLQSDGAQK